MRGRAGRDAHAPAQREDRIEHRTDRVRERPAVDHRDRRSDAAAAAEEAGPVGLDLGFPTTLAIDDGEMRSPDFRLGRRSPPARRQDGAYFGEIFGLDEQLGERRMRDVGGLRRQHELGIGRDLDLAHAAAVSSRSRRGGPRHRLRPRRAPP